MSFLPSLWLDLLTLAIALLGLGYVYATWTFTYWKDRGVPFVKPVPFLGNFIQLALMKKSLGEVYVDLYKELQGFSYGGFFKFRQPGLLICDPELAKQVMTRDFTSFHDNDIDITVEMDPMFGRNPFALRGEKWRSLRSKLTPVFTPGKLKPMLPLINEVCVDLKNFLHHEHTEELEAKELASKFTTDIVASCIFGLNGNSFTDPNAPFRQMAKDNDPTGIIGSIKIAGVFLMPSVAKLLKFRFFNENVSNFFRTASKNAMKYREENQVTRNDFLQLLMQLKTKELVTSNKDDNRESLDEFTDEDVAAQCATFFVDGYETSATALSFAMFELAVNTDCQDRLRAEVDEAMIKYNGEMSYKMLRELTYTDMVVAETLRKYPSSPILNRMCTKPYDLPTPDGGVLHVEVGTPIAFTILGFQTDPRFYPDPDRFDPERFNEENKAKRHPYAYLPFGNGPRGCLGIKFAQMQMKAGLASIVSNFEIQLSKRTAVPIVLKPSPFLLEAKGGIWLKFVPRALPKDES